MAHLQARAVARALPSGKAGTAGPGRVGPNAVIQLGAALRARLGAHTTRAVFAGAGLQAMLERPPAGMVEQAEAAALFASLFARLPRDLADEIAARAGLLTAEYVMRHRIPRAARLVLKTLPAALAAPLLLGAIRRHAWTFAGTGRVATQAGVPCLIEIADNPLAMPGCAWHAAVFERLFRSLVSPHARVAQRLCCHAGAPVCRFEIAVGQAKDGP